MDKVSVLYTDTDSLKNEYRVKDFYEETKDDVLERFDTSKMDKDHPATKVGYPVGKNQGVTLLMKNENPNKQIKKLVALGPKLYAEDDNVKAKGISKVVTKQELDFEVLNNCRLTEEKVLRKMTILRKRDHNWYTEEITKVAVKAEDDKRYVLEDKIHTLAPGHWRICGDYYIPFHIPYPRGDLGKLCLKTMKRYKYIYKNKFSS